VSLYIKIVKNNNFSHYHILFAIVSIMVIKYDKNSRVIKSVDISLALDILLLD